MNKILKYLTLKNTVAVTLISCGVLTVLILFTGLVFGSKTLDKIGNESSIQTGSESNSDSSGLQSSDVASTGASSQGSQTNDTGSSASNSTGGGTSSNKSATGSSNSGATNSTGTKTGTTSGGGSTTATATISNFSASPSSISYNSASTLSWTSANATSCSISTLGAVATSGTKSTGNLTSTKTFTLTCGTATKQVTVTVGNAPVACGQSGGTCTNAQVAAHASQGDCWMIYNGYYYIVTAYVNNHPGGKGVFNSSSCGHDITSYMNGSASTGGRQHSHGSSAYSVLNSYRVGQVQG